MSGTDSFMLGSHRPHCLNWLSISKTIEKLDKQIRKQNLQDLENIWYSVNDDTFKVKIEKLESKYCEKLKNNNNNNNNIGFIFTVIRLLTIIIVHWHNTTIEYFHDSYDIKA